MNTATPTATEPSWLKALGSVSTLAAALSFGILCAAFIHEWAYFGVVGRQFQQLMSPSDYITSSIGWLPFVGVMILAVIANEAFTKRLENFRTETQIWAVYKTPRRAWWGRQAPWTFLYAIGFVNAVLALLFLNFYHGGPIIGLGLVFLWYLGVQWYVAHPKVAISMTRLKFGLLLFVPPIALGSYLFGLGSGNRDLTLIDRAYIVKFKNEPTEKNVVVLRTFGVGVLTHDVQANRITLIKWDEISSLSLRIQPVDTRSITCWLFERGCFESQRGPTP